MALWPKGAPGYIRCGRAYYRKIGGKFNLIQRASERNEPCTIESEDRGEVIVALETGELVLVDKSAVQLTALEG